MTVGFVLGFIAAFASSATIAIVISRSMQAASLAEVPEVSLPKRAEAEIDRGLFDELRCI